MTDKEFNMTVNDGAQPERVVRVTAPSNSNKAKDARAQRSAEPEPEKKKVEKVISGEVTQRKKGLGRKIADTFTGDNMHSVGQYILHEIVIPQIKTIISDAVSQGTDRTLWGDSRRPTSSSTRSNGMRTNYQSNFGNNRYTNSPAGRAADRDGYQSQSRQRNSRGIAEIILDNRGDAEEVIDMMGNLINQYTFVTVSDLYDLVGITGEFTDEKWGWSDIRDIGIRRVSGGYLIDLPRPEPISA